MGAILFAMGCMGRKLRRDGVLNVARKVPLVLLKDGKGGQEVFIWDWEGEKGKATIMLMWPSSQRMDWKPLIWTYGDPAAHSYSSSLVVFSMYVISFESPNSVHGSMLCTLY